MNITQTKHKVKRFFFFFFFFFFVVVVVFSPINELKQLNKRAKTTSSSEGLLIEVKQVGSLTVLHKLKLSHILHIFPLLTYNLEKTLAIRRDDKSARQNRHF